MLLVFTTAVLVLLAEAHTPEAFCDRICPAGHRCRSRPVPDSECYNPPCGEKGVCVPDVPLVSCGDILCIPGDKCVDTSNGPKCVSYDVCSAVTCAVGEICDASLGSDKPCRPYHTCATTSCPTGYMCQDNANDDATCAPGISCANTLCNTGLRCRETPKGPECVDPCAAANCSAGFKCVESYNTNTATCEPVITCASTSCAVGTVCVDFPDKDAKCEISYGNGNEENCTAKCSAGQRCVFRPTPESECYNPPCADRPTCVAALRDDETSCETKQCYAGYKCVVQAGLARCILHRTCEELNCPSGQRCEIVADNARCVVARSCETVRCPNNQICIEGEGINAHCRPPLSCTTLLCRNNQVCRAGNGREDAVCVDGIAIDPCTSASCKSGETCQSFGGRATCVKNGEVKTVNPIKCNCVAGEKCVARAVVCAKAPCLPVLECKKIRECSANEVYADCSTCEPTCSNPSPICTLECKPAKCVCRNGFVRDHSGICVPSKACSVRPAPGVPNHLNNCEHLQCPIATTCVEYGDRAECLYGRSLQSDVPTKQIIPIKQISPVRETIQPIRETVKPIRGTFAPIDATISPIRATLGQTGCHTVKCSAGAVCVETKNGPICEQSQYTIGPVLLDDNLRVTATPIRILKGCLHVKCTATTTCVETSSGPRCEPNLYTIGPIRSPVLLADNIRPAILPKLSGCDCTSAQKCVAVQVNCFTLPCNPQAQCVPLAQCKLNEEWSECSSCNDSCFNDMMVCPAVCGPPKCQCKAGFARDQTGKCVARSKCPKNSIAVKPLALCASFLKSICKGNCYDYMDRAECVPHYNPFEQVLSDFQPHNVEDGRRNGFGHKAESPKPQGAKCELVDCRSGHKCIDTPTGAMCVPGSSTDNTPISQGTKCELVDCRSGHRCIDTPTGAMCVPGSSTDNTSISQGTKCELVDCRSGHRCIDTPTGAMCVPGTNSGNIPTLPKPTLTCATTNCATGNRCQDTVIGPLCIPNSGTNTNINTLNLNCNCEAHEECVLVQVHCYTMPCSPVPECRPKNGVPKPSITCANIRCAGICTDTPSGPECGPRRPDPSCATVDCPSGQECVESPSGPKCLPSYNSGDDVCTKPNEEYNQCGNLCEGTCEYAGELRVCPAVCRPPACACKEGYYRNANGDCVTADICPPRTPACSRPNEVLLHCGNHCENSCEFVGELRACTLDCRPAACGCDQGFYRNNNGECVPADQCPPKTPVCDANEVLNKCGNHCEGNCNYIDKMVACTKDCRPPACACKEGLYRNNSGACVPADQCVKQNGYGDEMILPDPNVNKYTNLSCPENESVNNCGNLCEAKCEHIGKGPVACIEICNPPACVCNSGFFRNNQGKCVPANACPNTPTYMGGKGGDGRIPYRL